MSVKAALQIIEESSQTTLTLINEQDITLVAHPDSGWQIKDILTHLTFVNEHSKLTLEGWLQGKEPDIPEIWNQPNANDLVREERKDYSVERVLNEYQSAVDALKAVYKTIPAEREHEKFMMPWRYHYTPEWFAQMLADHEAIHRDEIRAALKQTEASQA